MPERPMPETPVLRRLMTVIQQRQAQRPTHSYTTQLFDGGIARIGAKVREEAEELLEAAAGTGDQRAAHVIHEAADLFYHLLVLLAATDVSLDQVEAELARRFGVSGLEEKASRSTSRD